MTNLQTMLKPTGTDRAIILWRKKFDGDAVSVPAMSERQFNAFMHEAFGNPMDNDDWKNPVAKEAPEDDTDFSLIEYFQTPKGPVCAAHGKDDFRVYVAADSRLLALADHEGMAA